MFKAIDKTTGAEIIILDDQWEELLDQLRVLGRDNVLLCQECRQPVRVKAGAYKRRHFAHKHLADCPLQSESPEVLRARALLYRWLVGKFREGVTLEKKLEGSNLKRPVDCWVVTPKGRKVAFWIVWSQVRPKEREHLCAALGRRADDAHWVFLRHLLHEDVESQESYHLTTTEREFMRHSVYDVPHSPGEWCEGATLHYLNHETEDLTTLRGLHLIHEPQLYEGRRQDGPLGEVLASPRTGEFVHPGEHDRLIQYREEQRRREAEEEERKRRKAEKSRERKRRKKEREALRRAEEEMTRLAEAKARAEEERRIEGERRRREQEARARAEEERRREEEKRSRIEQAKARAEERRKSDDKWEQKREVKRRLSELIRAQRKARKDVAEGQKTPPAEKPAPTGAGAPPVLAAPSSLQDREGICEMCGKSTRDWVVFDNLTGTCKCRACLRSGA